MNSKLHIKNFNETEKRYVGFVEAREQIPNPQLVSGKTDQIEFNFEKCKSYYWVNTDVNSDVNSEILIGSVKLKIG